MRDDTRTARRRKRFLDGRKLARSMAGVGQASKRGSFDQRVAAAKKRNAYIESQLPKLNPNVRKFHSRHGTQRLALAMMAAGMLRGNS